VKGVSQCGDGEPRSFTELEDPVLREADPSVDRGPLDPGIEMALVLLCVGDVRDRLVSQALERRQLAVVDELIHEAGSELVELEHEDPPAHGHLLLSVGPFRD